MATSHGQDKDFADKLWHEIAYTLEKALQGVDASWVVEWVASNFEPQDVFEVSELDKWAESNGYVLES